MRFVARRKICLLLICSYILIESASGAISYGKLKVKLQTGHNEPSTLQGRSTVFATRESSFLNRDGDIFKLYKPAIAKNSPPDSISFESLRFPGNFLRANIDKGIFDFKMDRPVQGDYQFNKTASFLIQRNTGVRGTGMLRLMDQPSYYMCVNLKSFKPSLRATKEDTKTKKAKLKEMCSFYIQKLKPLTPILTKFSADPNSTEAVEDVDNSINAKSKGKQFVQQATNANLQTFAKPVETSHDIFSLSALSNVIKNFHGTGPHPTTVRKLLNDYEDKIRSYQRETGTKNLLAEFPDASKKKKLEQAKKGHIGSLNSRSKMKNVLLNPSPVHALAIPVNKTVLKQKNDRQEDLTRKFATTKNKVNTHVDKTSTTRLLSSYKETIAPYFNPSKIAALDLTNNDGPLKNDTISLTTSMLQYLYPQNTVITPDLNAHSAELTKMGPYTPVNLGDFSKQTHREPSLNIDGLVSSISVPSTRSNVSFSTMTLPGTPASKSGSALSPENQDNVLTKANDVTENKADATKNSIFNALYGVSKSPNNISQAISVTRSNKINESSNKLMNSTDIDQHLTMYYVKSKEPPTNKSDGVEVENLDEFLKNSTGLKAESDDSTDTSNNNILTDDIPPLDLTESNDTKPDDEANESNVTDSNAAGVDENYDVGVSDDFAMIDNNVNNTIDKNETFSNNTDTSNNTLTNDSSLTNNDYKNGTVENNDSSSKNLTSENNDGTSKNETAENNDQTSKNETAENNDGTSKPETSENNNDNSNKTSDGFLTDEKNKNIKNSLSAVNDSLINSHHLISSDDQQRTFPNVSDAIGKISIAATTNQTESVSNSKDYISRNETQNETSTKDSLFDMNDPLKDLLSGLSQVNISKGDENVEYIAKKSNESSEHYANITTGNASQSNNKSIDMPDKNNAKIYSYNDDDGIGLDTKTISVFGNNDLEAQVSSRSKNLNENLSKNFTHNKTNSVSFNASNGSENDTDTFSSETISLEKSEERKSVNLSSESSGTNETAEAEETADKCCVIDRKDSLEYMNDSQGIDNTTNPTKSVSLQIKSKNSSGSPLPANAVEHVEFAKEIEHVEIAVSDKGQASNITKPVLAKSYVKDKTNGNGNKNATHTIDGNFVVKYDEPLSESTTREIANNIFKAVFNTLNKTAIPSSPINSNGVERATIEKNRDDRFTDNLFAHEFEGGKGNDDDDENLFESNTKDKISSNGTLSDANKDAGNRNNSEMDGFKNETNKVEHSNLGKERMVKNEETPNPDEKVNLKKGDEEESQNNGTSHNISPDSHNGNETENENETKTLFDYNALPDESPNKKVTSERKGTNKKPSPEVPLPIELSKLKDFSKNSSDLEKENKTDDNKTEENSQNKEPLILAKDADDGKEKDNQKIKIENKDEEGANKTLNVPKTKNKELLVKKLTDTGSSGEEKHEEMEPNIEKNSKYKSTDREASWINMEPNHKANETGDVKSGHHAHKLLPTHDDEEIQQTEQHMQSDAKHLTTSPEGDSIAKDISGMNQVHTHPIYANTDQHSQGSVENTVHHEAPVVKGSASIPEHDINVDQITPHGPRRHTNHIITVKDDNEKETLLNKLVNYDYDKCVFMKLINDIKSPYRLISSVNRHGYKPRGMVFTLKTVLKDPDLHQFVAFRAIDENDPKRVITLDGQKDLVTVPVLCHGAPRIVHVESQQPPKAIANAMTRILAETRHVETTAEDAHKKHRIPVPRAGKNITVNGNHPVKSIVSKHTHAKATLNVNPSVKSTIHEDPSLFSNRIGYPPIKSKFSEITPIKSKFSEITPIKSKFSQITPIKSTIVAHTPVKTTTNHIVPIRGHTSVKSAIQIPFKSTVNMFPPFNLTINSFPFVKSTIFQHPTVAATMHKHPAVKMLIPAVSKGVPYVHGLVNARNITVRYTPAYVLNHKNVKAKYPYGHTSNRKNVIKVDSPFKQHLYEYFNNRILHKEHRGDIIKRYTVRHGVSSQFHRSRIHDHKKG